MSQRNSIFSIRPWVLGLISGAMLVAGQAQAHFQMIIPSDDMVTQGESRTLNLDVLFWHPFEMHGLNMVKPEQFGVMMPDGKKTSLLDTLKAVKLKDSQGEMIDAFKTAYAIKSPGDMIFYVEPKPYWEPAEDKYIVHYTKVVVNGFGLEEGWEQTVGFKTEIVPLTRPYGLHTGNIFQGVVMLNGKPAPNTTVEVEYYNKDGKLKANADPMVTQVVKTDANGVFTYAMPKAGWWGFAALSEDENKMVHDGKEYPVEIGAVIWIETHDMK
jgi:cobalt/nickel transport protein